jgi:hypothetical protein
VGFGGTPSRACGAGINFGLPHEKAARLYVGNALIFLVSHWALRVQMPGMTRLRAAKPAHLALQSQHLSLWLGEAAAGFRPLQPQYLDSMSCCTGLQFACAMWWAQKPSEEVVGPVVCWMINFSCQRSIWGVILLRCWGDRAR